MAQDIPQLIADARAFLAKMAYASDERTVLLSVVNTLAATHLAAERTSDDRLEPHLPEHVQGGKRCGIQRSAWLPSFYVGWSPRNENENAEGPWSDWVALAHAILAADVDAQTKLQGEA
ncbi:hypothetical protein [Sphingomonas sp. NFX23]|uniref:hypothetical protein n=1 Tax=Sphingomonas sp. NFX23 TaxID=2819532 RepID=UPI003CFBB048